MVRAAAGFAVSVVLAASVSGATLFGIDVWKITLAAVGLVVFVMGGKASGGRR